MNEPSVFTKIIAGEIPGEIIYQDELCAVLLSIDPLSPGHCLVVPKQEVDLLWDVEDTTYSHLFEIAKQTARQIDKAYEYKRVGLIVEGFSVPHAHIHVFGYTEGLEEMVAHRVEDKAHRAFATPEQLTIEAAKLRA